MVKFSIRSLSLDTFFQKQVQKRLHQQLSNDRMEDTDHRKQCEPLGQIETDFCVYSDPHTTVNAVN